MRQQARPVHRRLERRGGRVVGTVPGGRRVEQGLDVDEKRLVAPGDQVLVVEVGAVQGVQQRQQGALTAVEARQLLLVRAGQVGDVLDPSVPGPVQQRRHRQTGRAGPRVEPADDLVEVPVGAERPRLVDHVAAVGEGEDGDGATASVPVPGSARHADQRPRVGSAQQGGDDVRPVGLEAPQQFGQGLRRMQTGLPQQARQHRVRGEQGGEAGPTGRHGEETAEPFGRCVTGEVTAPPRRVEFQHQRPGRPPCQRDAQPPDELGPDRREIDRSGLGAWRDQFGSRLREGREQGFEPGRSGQAARGPQRRHGGEHPVHEDGPVRRLPSWPRVPVPVPVPGQGS